MFTSALSGTRTASSRNLLNKKPKFSSAARARAVIGKGSVKEPPARRNTASAGEMSCISDHKVRAARVLTPMPRGGTFATRVKLTVSPKFWITRK